MPPILVPEVAKRILFEIADVLEAHGLVPLLLGGTCLGAIREKGFIKHDRDMDIGLLYENFKPVGEELVKEFKKRKFLVKPIYRPLPVLRAIKLDKNHIHTDIATWFLHENGKVRWCPSTVKPRCTVFPVSLFTDIVEVPMFGRMFHAPGPVDKYMALNFGNTYMTPIERPPRPSYVINYLKKPGAPRMDNL